MCHRWCREGQLSEWAPVQQRVFPEAEGHSSQTLWSVSKVRGLNGGPAGVLPHGGLVGTRPGLWGARGDSSRDPLKQNRVTSSAEKVLKQQNEKGNFFLWLKD